MAVGHAPRSLPFESQTTPLDTGTAPFGLGPQTQVKKDLTEQMGGAKFTAFRVVACTVTSDEIGA